MDRGGAAMEEEEPEPGPLPGEGKLGGGDRGKGKSKGHREGAPLDLDPLSPCGYFLAGHCKYGEACSLSHDLEYARALRAQWLSPGDKAARRELKTRAGSAGLPFEPRILAKEVVPSKGGTGSLFEESECPFRFLAVLDLEGQPQFGGITEFPVLLLETQAMREVARFQRWVRLATVEAAVTTPLACGFLEVLSELRAFLLEHGLDLDSPGRDFAFVTCGDWDLRSALPGEMELMGPAAAVLPLAFRSWINIKEAWNAHFGSRIRGMRGALAQLRLLDAQGRPRQGCHHLGMHDVDNIGRIVLHLLQVGADLDVTAKLP